MANQDEVEYVAWEDLPDDYEVRMNKSFWTTLIANHNRQTQLIYALNAYASDLAAHINDLIIRVNTLEMQRDAESFLAEQADVKPIDLDDDGASE